MPGTKSFVRSWRPLMRLVAFAAAAAAPPVASGASGEPLADALAAGFAAPPAEVRPRTFWFWMNGNVTREGITRDLEAMQRIGMGGVMIFDGSTYLPAGPAAYLGSEWRALMTHAIKEGDRLGLAVGMHNAPGWSSSGGPWVKPEQAMQQIAWTETTVRGGGRVEIALRPPQTNLGYYRDAVIVAFPALAGESVGYEDAIARISAGAAELPKEVLSDGRTDTVARVASDAPLVIEFREPVELHALTAQPGPRGGLPRLAVSSSLDGRTFRPVCGVAGAGRHGIAAPSAREFPPTAARFVRVAPVSASGEIGELVLHRTPRVPDWPTKANFDYRVSGQMSQPRLRPGQPAIDPASVQDLTGLVRDGRLAWDAPPGDWTILRIGHTPTGKENVAASAAGKGLETDKFSAAATEHHFRHVIAQVRADAAAAGATGPATVTIDSYEAGMQNWTADFPAEFRRRAGYALTPYSPALVGRVVGDDGVSDRFLYDFRRVQADLMAENYYARMGELVRAAGMRFFVEGYGTGPFDELRVSGVPDVPMTEFWTRTPWTPNRVVKMVTSAAHVYGKPVVGAESFTGWAESSRWLEYPYALKLLGDEMFAHGVNHLVFHRYAHQPHPDAAPGMAMGPYGSHLERTNTWFEQAGGWIEYLSRCHFLLRQGTYVADVLYFTGERSPDPAQYALPPVPPGYNYDLVNADVLLNRMRVEQGEYVLPEGSRYRLLVLAEGLGAMRPELMRKLQEFVAQGGAILGHKPAFSPTLRGFPQSEQEMLRLADEVWGKPGRGPGRVLVSGSIDQALRSLGVAPDFTFTGTRPDAAVAWQHRRLPDGDLYFIANRQRRVEEITASFRGMAGRQPEIWHPESARRRAMPLFRAEGDRALVPLRLEPGESVFVLFRGPGKPAAAAVWADGQPATGGATAAGGTGASGDFTMAIWVKPDTNLRVMPTESTSENVDETGKFYAIPADPGDVRFGPGHATAGLAVGRNGIFVVERTKLSNPAVLVAPIALSGWTHVAVVYRSGTPRLYVNGAFVREGQRTGRIVHSGVGSPPPPLDYVLPFPALERMVRNAGASSPAWRGQVYYFEGNSTPAEEFSRALEDAEIAAIAARGVPPPALPVVTEPAREDAGAVSAVAWRSGSFTLEAGRAAKADVPAPKEVPGPWRVTFQEGRGAPPAIDLPALRSLHLHGDPGVKYFSGTAAYRGALEIPAAYLGADRRVVLDLGRVEVHAEVFLNGRRAGLLWKEPYRIDVTDLARAGSNDLEVRVTNLWPNRLIGDEQLPAEDEFGLGDERGAEAGGIRRLPDWYLQGRPKPPGGRVTFATWKFYSSEEPLLASGLLGPVRLLNPVRLTWPASP